MGERSVRDDRRIGSDRGLKRTVSGDLHSFAYRPLYYTRIVAWAFSPLVPLLVLAAAVFPGTAPGAE
ncbi:hypothetical protein JCM31271_23180 [Halorubrum trueperi]